MSKEVREDLLSSDVNGCVQLAASGSAHPTNLQVLLIVPLRSKLHQPDAPEGSEAMACLSLTLEYRCSDAHRSGLVEAIELD